MTSFPREATAASTSARHDTERQLRLQALGLLRFQRNPTGQFRQVLRSAGAWKFALASLGVTYLFACWGMVVFERRFSYQPDPQHTTPEAVRLSGVTERIIATPDGQRLVAWAAKAKPGQPTLLYFHGNGNALTYRSGRIASFQAEGYGVLMIAYRGYSGSTGGATEDNIVADARLAYDTLRKDGLSPEDIVIYGESLGTSVAVQTAIVKPARALILEAPFTSMVDAWKQFVPYLPVDLLLRDRFETKAVIAQVRMPLLVMHGERDKLVGFQLGRALFAAASEPKRFEAFPEARHTDLYDYNAIAAVRTFVSDVRARRLGGAQK